MPGPIIDPINSAISNGVLGFFFGLADFLYEIIINPIAALYFGGLNFIANLFGIVL